LTKLYHRAIIKLAHFTGKMVTKKGGKKMSDNQETKKIGVRQFRTGNFIPHGSHVSNEDYGQILDNVVVGYVNCFLVAQEKRLAKMLLVKRVMEPWTDWWIPGGRINPGESFEETAIRNLKRQLSLAIDDRSRFRQLGTYAFIWARRAHPPIEHGCHIVSAVLVLEVNGEEVKAIRLNEEHCDLSWSRPEIIVIQTGIHLGLAQCIRDLIDSLGLKKSG
jgi:ADP-ribose pyrophosphatase YjhB (NUDIX family)